MSVCNLHQCLLHGPDNHPQYLLVPFPLSSSFMETRGTHSGSPWSRRFWGLCRMIDTPLAWPLPAALCLSLSHIGSWGILTSDVPAFLLHLLHKSPRETSFHLHHKQQKTSNPSWSWCFFRYVLKILLGFVIMFLEVQADICPSCSLSLIPCTPAEVRGSPPHSMEALLSRAPLRGQEANPLAHPIFTGSI